MARRWEKAFLKALSETANVTRSAKTAGVDRRTAYLYRDDNEEFAKEWDKALKIGIGTLEDEANRRATEGIIKPIFYKGDVVGHVRDYSDTLMIFLLKAHKPEVYNPPAQHQLSGPDGKPIPLQMNPFADMSDDELNNIIETDSD